MFLGGAIIGIAGAIIITSTVLLGKTIEPGKQKKRLIIIQSKAYHVSSQEKRDHDDQ